VDIELNARLADFGLTIVGETSAAGMTTTHSGTGTLRWKSPERLMDDDRRTAAGDIWAIGCLCIVVRVAKRFLISTIDAIQSCIPGIVLTPPCLMLS
jgi:serine/threonine protein kinase